MSTRGNIIRGAGGYLKRNTDLGVGIGQPHGGDEGDIRVQMVDGSPKLYAKAGGQWYGINLQASTFAGGVSDEFILGNISDYIKITPENGLEVINNNASVSNLGKTLRIGQDSTSKSALRVSSDGSMDIGVKDASYPAFSVSTTGAITVTDVVLAGRIKTSGIGTSVIIGDYNMTAVSSSDLTNSFAVQNVVIGELASQDVTVSTSRRYQNNVAIGTGATKNINPSGTSSAQTEDNVHIGTEAGAYLWGGDGNIGIGKLALSGTSDSGNSSGEIQNYNIGIGWSAGADINAGSYNICIGYQAGNTGDGIEDGTGNVLIGYGEPAVDADRTLNIGTRNASYLTRWIAGTSPAGASGWGNVGIGTAAPNQILTVEGTMSMKEQADDGADVAGYSQIWVDDAGAGTLMFTNDAGTKYTVDVTEV